MWWVVLTGWWTVACAVAAQYVARQKGRSMAEGYLLGVTLGPIGALVVALLPDNVPTSDKIGEPRLPSPHIKGSCGVSNSTRSEEVAVDPSKWR
jgi:hypothetical protein